MRLLTHLFFLLSLPSVTFGQVITIDIDLKGRGFNKETRLPYFVESNDSQILYALLPNVNEQHYQLYAFNQDFEITEQLATVDIGANGDLRDIYIHDEHIICAKANVNGVYNGNFSLSKTAIQSPDDSKEVIIEFDNKEVLIAANEHEDSYCVITLNKQGLMKIYTIDIKTLAYTEKEIERNYQAIYAKVEAMLSFEIGFTQIDEDKYFDLQATSSNFQSYFVADNYILSTEENGQNAVYVVDLKTGALSTKRFLNLYNNRTSILQGNKYYIFEVDGLKITLKIYDFETTNLLKVYFVNKKDANVAFQSTAVFEDAYEITKTSKIINKYYKTDRQTKSIGIIPEIQDSITILTFGVPTYTASYSGGYGGNSNKFDYKYGRINPMYLNQITFESWVNPDETIVPFDKTAATKSTYQKIYKLLTIYQKHTKYSKFSVFQFNGEWYLGCYNTEKKQYLVYRI